MTPLLLDDLDLVNGYLTITVHDVIVAPSETRGPGPNQTVTGGPTWLDRATATDASPIEPFCN